MPSPVEALPCGSRSMISVRWPSSARHAPRLIVVVVLPTPPFWLATAMTRGSGAPAPARRRSTACRRRVGDGVQAGLGRAHRGLGRSVGHSGPGRPLAQPGTHGQDGSSTLAEPGRCFTWNISTARPRLTLDVPRETSTAGSTADPAVGARRSRPTPTPRGASGGHRSVAGGRLADDEQAAGARAEDAARRSVRRVDRSPGPRRRRPVRQTAAAPRRRPSAPRHGRRGRGADQPAQVIGPRARRSTQHESQVRTGAGDDQTGHATATAEIDDRARRRRARASTKAPACSMTSSIGRSRACPAAGTRRAPRSAPRRRHRRRRVSRRDDHAAVGILALGAARPRRRSPPSASWRTLRSADGIGSSERATPVSRTCSATVAANRSSATRRFSR